ncbi:MAG: TVP38/TMEM64 family protein [Pseudomonadota bacterium]|jgi:uncharacterized membrane protein YdjX (TVP38/TMEM64 family)
MNAKTALPRDESRGGKWLRVALVLLVIGALAYGYHALDLGRLADRRQIGAHLAELRLWQAEAGLWGMAEFALAGTAVIILNVPCVLVILAAATLYGALGGIVMGIVTLNLASVLIYLIGRHLGRAMIMRVFGRAMHPMEHHFGNRGLISVIHLRLLFFALPPVNWFLAVMNLRLRDLTLGTLIGSLPKIALYAWLGDVVIDKLAYHPEQLHWYSPELLTPMLAGIVLSLLLRFADRRWISPRAEQA